MLYLLAETRSSLEKELRNFYQKYGKEGAVTWQQARRWAGDKDHVVLILSAYKVELKYTLLYFNNKSKFRKEIFYGKNKHLF